MRILLLTSYYPPEIRSASQLMFELAQGLAARGHQVTVLTPASGYNLADGSKRPKARLVSFSEEDGVRVVRVLTAPFQMVGPITRGIGHLSLPFSLLVGGLLTGPADVIAVYSPPLTTAVGALMLSLVKGAPYVLNVQDLFPQNAIDLGVLKGRALIGIFRFLESWVCKHAAAVTVHSEGNCKHITLLVQDPARVVVVHNWVDLDAYRTFPDQNVFRVRYGLEGSFLVLFAGVMGYAQDLETVIEAAYELRDHKGIAFLLVGDGVGKPALLRKVETLGLTNVKFLPWVSPEEYPQLVAGIDVGLVTLKKGMKTPVVPSKLLGYMAAGKPVVASLNRESDAIPILETARCGVTVPPGDPKAMAGAIGQLYRSSSRRQDMGKRGRAYAALHFPKTKAIHDYESVLENCLHR